MGNKNEIVLNVFFGYFRFVIMNSIFCVGNEFKKIFGFLFKFQVVLEKLRNDKNYDDDIKVDKLNSLCYGVRVCYEYV